MPTRLFLKRLSLSLAVLAACPLALAATPGTGTNIGEHHGRPDLPPAADRAAWEEVKSRPENAAEVAFLRAEAMRLKETHPAPLRLTEYLEFFRTGERFAFENRYYARRRELAILVMAECLDHRGEYLPAIADRVWQICEETSWCIPAHAVQQADQPEETPPPLRLIPGTEPYPFPDLFACETAATLAETLHLLGPELEGISRAIRPRVLEAARRQVFDSFLANDHYTWQSGHNNWAPWCASSLLLAAPVLETDPSQRDRIVDTAAAVLVRFLDRLPPDGFSEEGPSYAFVSLRGLTYGGEVLRTLGHPVNPYAHPRLKRMVDAFAAVLLGDGLVANFGPCEPRFHPQPTALWRLAARLDSSELQRIAEESSHHQTVPGSPRGIFQTVANAGSLLHMVRDLLWRPESANAPGPVPARPLAQEFPASQVAVLRERGTEPQGWVVAVLGGHNAASHNHNDVGHFILLRDARLLVCDVGRETYHKDSWGPRRYEAWNLRGAGHNAPVVNGHEQAPGREHAARAARLIHDADTSTYALDLAAIYPAAARVSEAHRTVELERGGRGGVTILDRLGVESGPLAAEWNLYSPEEPQRGADGTIRWPGSPSATLRAEAPDATVEIVAVELTDGWLRKAWGEHLWRIRITSRSPDGRLEARLSFGKE